MEIIKQFGLPLMLIYFIIFTLVIRSKLRNAPVESSKKSVLELDHIGNTTRFKELPPLNYIVIDPQVIPSFPDQPDIHEVYLQLMDLIALPAVCFHNMTNTELKIKYGMNHFNTISRYESNYARLMRCLFNYSKLLLEHHNDEAAFQLSKIAFESETDITEHIRLYLQIAATREDGKMILTDAFKQIAESELSFKDKLLAEIDQYMMSE